MRTIIAGSRPPVNSTLDESDFQSFCKIIEKYKDEISTIISGGARGIDQFAIRYAKENNIPVKILHADWNKYGRGAGAIRNREMVKIADALIAVWDGRSKGTFDTIKCAIKANNIRKIHIIKFDQII